MRSARAVLWPVLGGLVCLSACAALLREPAAGPPDWRETKVSHKIHTESDLTCDFCHEDVFESEALTGRSLPKEEVCLECHDVKEDGECEFCHTRPKNPRTYPERERFLHFSHVSHIERVEEDCGKCHEKLPEPDAEGPTRLTPTMDACLGCHNHEEDYDAGRCEACHTDLARYGERSVALFSHEGDWVRDHAGDARAMGATCASTCHDSTFCSDCHADTVATLIELRLPADVDRDFIHRHDFESRHSIEARMDPAMCNRCHGRSFCQDCHAARGMTPGSPSILDPHGAGWYDESTGGFHGEAARMDITSCAACHEDGPTANCVTCHRVGGIGGDPHPDSFSRSSAEIGSNPMCLYCHTE